MVTNSSNLSLVPQARKLEYLSILEILINKYQGMIDPPNFQLVSARDKKYLKLTIRAPLDKIRLLLANLPPKIKPRRKKIPKALTSEIKSLLSSLFSKNELLLHRIRTNKQIKLILVLLYQRAPCLHKLVMLYLANFKQT